MRRAPLAAPLAAAVLLGLVAAACSDGTATTTTTTTTTTLPGDPGTTTTDATGDTESPTETTEPSAPAPPLDDVSLDLTEVASGFAHPVFAAGRSGDPRLYVVDQPGRIYAVSPDGSHEVVLDIAARVDYRGERGLLGIAFHPTDATRLFVHYSATQGGAGVLEEYRFPLDAAAVDPDRVRTLLTVGQPAANHNGGMIEFGPDGMLYIALGDGGGAGDQYRNGQDPSTLLGSMLRIDVGGGGDGDGDGDAQYAIPPDNPFAGGGDGAPEVWVYGLRNPWRFAWDGNQLWIADVGQGAWEEINLVGVGDGGANFGWPIMEGSACHDGPQSLCDDNDFVDPIFEYTIANSPRCAIMGGYVYRGAASPSLFGAYLFADHCTGEIMALRAEGGEVVDHRVFDSIGERITSFGTDADGEIYVVSARAVYRLDASA